MGVAVDRVDLTLRCRLKIAFGAFICQDGGDRCRVASGTWRRIVFMDANVSEYWWIDVMR